MTAAEQSLRDGDLDQALRQLQDDVRRQPADPKRRIFLFQLLVVLGQWERALNQLKVVAELDPGALMMVHTYREAIRCEFLRAKVFAGEQTPLIFGDPERWIALLLEALRVSATGEHARAQELRDEALALAPASSGTINGDAFAWIADADTRLGPMLEVVISGAYYWIPLNRIGSVRIGDPEDLRDLVWTPAEFRWSNGGDAVGLIPGRYPGSEESGDARIRLGRVTEWEEVAADLYVGRGQRMLATDAGEYSLLDVRQIEVTAAEIAAPAVEGAAAGG